MAHGNRTHGQSRRKNRPASPLYQTWCGMIKRCHCPTYHYFHDYGGRGIVVCERWRGSFESFAADMGNRPPGTSIDRIDNDGPYNPENCRWATRQEQNRNKRSCIYVAIKGRTQCLADWAKELAIVKYRTAHARIAKGWDAYKALTTPVRK